MDNLDITQIAVGFVTLCGVVVTGLLTLIGTLYGTALQRNKLNAETKDVIASERLKQSQVESEIQAGLIRLNNELEQKIGDLKTETRELRDELRGVKEDKRILEERLLDIQRKYEAILQEYQALMADNARKTAENEKLRAELDEQRALLEDLKEQLQERAE